MVKGFVLRMIDWIDSNRVIKNNSPKTQGSSWSLISPSRVSKCVISNVICV